MGDQLNYHQLQGTCKEGLVNIVTAHKSKLTKRPRGILHINKIKSHTYIWKGHTMKKGSTGHGLLEKAIASRKLQKELSKYSKFLKNTQNLIKLNTFVSFSDVSEPHKTILRAT